jgi:hypothetical protein
MGLAKTTSAFDKIKVDRTDMGRADTLRYNILVYVVEENYERAIHELKNFMSLESAYPSFKKRIERYVNHAIDLVNAIKAKRRFPGVNSLTMAKQQEIVDRFHEHFAELQTVMKHIEKIERELKLEDIRSTILVIRALVNAGVAIAVAALVIEGARGLLLNVFNVADDALVSVTTTIFQKIGL